jgi:hypothetical protein
VFTVVTERFFFSFCFFLACVFLVLAICIGSGDAEESDGEIVLAISINSDGKKRKP